MRSDKPFYRSIRKRCVQTGPRQWGINQTTKPKSCLDAVTSTAHLYNQTVSICICLIEERAEKETTSFEGVYIPQTAVKEVSARGFSKGKKTTNEPFQSIQTNAFASRSESIDGALCGHYVWDMKLAKREGLNHC